MTTPYPNPLIPGFNPDPSCVLVDGMYYLVTSSFEYMPGLPVYRSADFVTWEHVGNVAERMSPGVEVTLRISTRRPRRLMPNDGAGGDRVTVTATGEDGRDILVAELDGRFWSAETAASFTGRVIGPFAESGEVRFRDYAHQGGDGPNGLAHPGERVEL